MKDSAAYETALQCLHYSEMSGESEAISRSYNLLGCYFHASKQYEQAIQYFEKGIQIAENSTAKKSLHANIMNVSQIYYEIGNFEKAILLCQKAVSLEDDVPEYQRDKALCYALLGKYFSSSGQYESAFDYFDKAIVLSKKIGTFPVEIEVLVNKGETLFTMKRFLEARKVCAEAMVLISKTFEEEIIFRIKVLAAKLSFVLEDKNAAIQSVKTLCETVHDEYNSAYLHYELWCMTLDDTCREKALKLYEDITGKTSRFQYKEHLSHLRDKKSPLYPDRSKPLRKAVKMHSRRLYPGAH